MTSDPGAGRARAAGDRIDERVRDAHLEHFCPGGAGFPVTDPLPAGPAAEPGEPKHVRAHAARGGGGETCGRCGQAIGSGQDARRRASGDWVHETCPPST